jgi:hypothetical protein
MGILTMRLDFIWLLTTVWNGSDEEPRRLENLVLAGRCALKSEDAEMFKTIYKRLNMLSFKNMDPQKSSYPLVLQLNVWQNIETGSYSSAFKKCENALRKCSYLPQNHNSYLSLIEAKAEAAEGEGNMKEMKICFDTLDRIAIANFGKGSLLAHEIQLRRGNYEIFWGGDLMLAKRIFNKDYTGYLSNAIHTFSKKRLKYLDGIIKLLDYQNKLDSALTQSIYAYDIVSMGKKYNAEKLILYLSMMAGYAFDLGKYSLTSEYLQKSEKLERERMIVGNADYFKALFIQSGLYTIIGEFDKANRCVIKANRISLEKDEKRFTERTETQEHLAEIYQLNGNFYRAELKLKDAMDAKVFKAGKTGFILLGTYIQIASLELKMGDLKLADRFLNEALTIVDLYFSQKDSRFHSMIYDLRSKYYTTLSDRVKAKEEILKAIDLSKKIYGENHFYLAPLYSTFASNYFLDGLQSFGEADKMYEKANVVILNSIGVNTAVYANFLIEKADFYIETNEYAKADKLLLDAQRFWLIKLGSDNKNMADVAYMIGKLNYKKKNYEEAERQYRRSASIYASVFSERHPSYLKSASAVARVLYMTKDYKKAALWIEPVLDDRLSYTESNFPIMNFGQKSVYWNESKDDFEFYNSVIYQLESKDGNGSYLGKMYNYTLRTKGLILKTDAQLRRQVFQSKDSVLTALYQEWLYEKEYLALISTFSKTQQDEEKIKVPFLMDQIALLEKEINSKTDASLSSNSKKASWIDVRNSLEKYSTALEIIRFRYFNHTFKDTVIYGGLFVDENAKSHPEVIFNINGKKLESSNLKYFRNSTISRTEDDYSYEAFWEIFKTKIPDGNRVYISTEGAYAQLNIEMMINTKTGKYAMDVNPIVYVSTTKDLIRETIKKKSDKETNDGQVVLIGNPKFYLTPTLHDKENIASLIGAEKEVSEINQIFRNRGLGILKLMGADVIEDTVRNLESPMILHIATHGYFSERKANVNELMNNPMLNSGLLLAGSGNILENTENRYVNQTPGVLTASEVMDMNFTKTNLVVLSACETGRGQVEVGEGVYGLQRAFLVAGAGAKSIILSLFKVDDEATRLLMVKFYEKSLANGGDYRTAFREAKQELKSQEKFKDPIFWGAFVMIEGTPKRVVALTK